MTSVSPTESALIVAVPEAEPAVAALRAAYDPSASWGVPAHITVLYPFLPPDRIDAAVLAAVRATVAGVPAFDLVLARTRRFGDQVLWLAPEPDAPLRALTELKAGLPGDLLGPAPLLRLRGKFRAQLVAKTDQPRRVAARAGRLLSAAAPAMRRAGLSVVVDVDPQGF